MRVAYVTTARQGAGHFTRGVALGRGLERAGFTGEFRLFSPALPYALDDRFAYRSFVLGSADALDPARAPHCDLARALAEYAPDVVLVDLYWYAVQNLLPALDAEVWLLVRCCPKNWFAPRRLATASGTLVTAFDRSRYHRIVAIEPIWFDFFTDYCPPVVVCNPDECRPPSALRRRLGVPTGRRLVVATHAGLEGELATLHVDRSPGDVVATFSLFDAGALYPVSEWLCGADVLYSGAGYNSYWEARWLGYDRRTRFQAFPRSTDWQAWRLRRCADLAMRENGADVLARWIKGMRPNLLTRVVRRVSRTLVPASGSRPDSRSSPPGLDVSTRG